MLRISRSCCSSNVKENALLHSTISVRDVLTRFHPYYFEFDVAFLIYSFYAHQFQNLSFTTITESPGCIKATPRWFSNNSLSKHFQLMLNARCFSLGLILILLSSSTFSHGIILVQISNFVK